MSAKDDLTARLGDRMRASMGADSAVVPLGPPPVSGKYDGVKAYRDARLIPLSRIVADPGQPRKSFPEEALERLAASLRERGLLQPIRVRWDGGLDRWVVVAGERRFRAAARVGWSEIPCVTVEAALAEGEVRLDQLVENCVREGLEPVEQAEAFRALMDARGWSARRLAEELRVSHQTVGRALALLGLPAEVLDRVREGDLAPRTAAEIAGLPAEADRVEVARRVVAEGLTHAEAADAVREKAGKRRDRAEFKLDDGSRVVVTGPAAADEAATRATLQKLLRKLGKAAAA